MHSILQADGNWKFKFIWIQSIPKRLNKIKCYVRIIVKNAFFFLVFSNVVFSSPAEVQAIASMIEKQAQIVVKQKDVSAESKKRKEALLAQYANITDEEEYPWLCKVTFR